MDDYKKIPFDDPDLCVPDLDDFDQMKEFFLDCAAEYFRYLSSDDMEKMLAALGKRVDVLATPTDDVFISVSPDAVLRQYPNITIDEAIQIRDNACENIWESGGQSDLDEIVWDQIGAEYKSIKSDSHRGLSDVKDAKAKQAVHVNPDPTHRMYSGEPDSTTCPLSIRKDISGMQSPQKRPTAISMGLPSSRSNRFRKSSKSR